MPIEPDFCRKHPRAIAVLSWPTVPWPCFDQGGHSSERGGCVRRVLARTTVASQMYKLITLITYISTPHCVSSGTFICHTTATPPPYSTETHAASVSFCFWPVRQPTPAPDSPQWTVLSLSCRRDPLMLLSWTVSRPCSWAANQPVSEAEQRKPWADWRIDRGFLRSGLEPQIEG